MNATPRPASARRLGVTGHQVLPTTVLALIKADLQEAVDRAGTNATGVTSLAAGSDQLFAREVLAAGGQLYAVLPCQGYAATFDGSDQVTYQDLLEQAETVETLPFAEPSEQAFYAAGRRVVDLCDLLLAIWDGQPARGLGGTADVVTYARQSGREVRVIWPAGTSR